MAEAYQVDAAQFWQRVQKLYSVWQAGRSSEGPWSHVDAIVVDSGKYDEEALYLKSSAAHTWLFGLELPETVLLFTQSMVYALAGAKKVAILEGLMSKRPDSASVSLLCYTRNKADKDAANHATLLEKVRGSWEGKKAAMLLKETPGGEAALDWRTAVSGAVATSVDLAPALAELLQCKDEAEQTLLRRAALFSAQLLREFLLPEIERIVDEGSDKRHADLAEDAEEFARKADVLARLKLPPAKYPDPENLDTCYTPIIQSGGVFNLKPSAESSSELLHAHVITVSLGGKYRSYCSNVGRSYVVNPSRQQEREYRALLAAEDALIAALVPGKLGSEAVQAAIDALEASEGGAALSAKLGKSLGFCTGLEFRDASFVLSLKNHRPVLESMVFALTVGLEGLENPKASDPRSRSYALYLSDTVLVGPQAPELLTAKATRDWAEVSYQINEPDAPGGAQARGKENGRAGRAAVELTESRTRGKGQQAANTATDERLREHQLELEEKLVSDALRRIDTSRGGGGGGRGGGAVIPTAYKSLDAFPREMSYNQIFVDVRAESVLVPVFGAMVPFHISTIKNVTKSEEGAYTYLRINFNTPGQGLGTTKESAALVESLKLKDSIRELTLRARDPKNLAQAFRLVKELRTRVMRRAKEDEEKKGLVEQEALRVLAGGRSHRLRDVNMRPNPSGRKSVGTLEVHVNGLRFTSNKGERVDLSFKNMQNCFFQPAVKEHIVLLHFHLHNGIIVGKKKVFDVQFFVEVVDQSYALDQARRGGGYDPDEVEDERRERALRNRMNAEFKTFAQKIEEQAGDLQFDIPYREHGFFGLTNKSTSLIMPTVNALVELVEPPWLVVQLADIEIVHFERVTFGVKNFDMMILFKDFKRDPIQIGTINMQSLDEIKMWLDTCDIKFYEGPANLHWGAIMKQVREDPRGFYEEDAWRFLDLERKGSDEEESSEEDEESSFAPSGSEEAEEEDSDEDEGDGSGDEDGSDYSGSGASGSGSGSESGSDEKGKDWDELEKEAHRSDRKRGLDDDDAKKKGKSGKRRDASDEDDSDGGGSSDDSRPKKKKPGPPPKGASVGKGKPAPAPSRPAGAKAPAPPLKKKP